jgi:hypothetical protein
MQKEIGTPLRRLSGVSPLASRRAADNRAVDTDALRTHAQRIETHSDVTRVFLVSVARAGQQLTLVALSCKGRLCAPAQASRWSRMLTAGDGPRFAIGERPSGDRAPRSGPVLRAFALSAAASPALVVAGEPEDDMHPTRP